MKLCLDQNNILCASETSEQGKQYTHSFDGYTVSSYDKTVFVEHKKTVKTIQYKDIGNTMSVFYVANRKSALRKEPLELHHNGAMSALTLYKWYDEATNNNYAFLYKYPSNNVNILNTQLQLLGIKAHVNTTDKWLIVSGEHTDNTMEAGTANIEAIMSYLFVLALLYGKLDIRESALMHVKIHVHLFGAFLREQQVLDTMLFLLQSKGIFLQKTITENNDGITYQITSNDYEFLAWFAQLYKSIAKIDKIPTFDKMSQARSTLIARIQSLQETGELTIDDAVMDMLEQQIVKVITK
jgi:hypothetical protein